MHRTAASYRALSAHVPARTPSTRLGPLFVALVSLLLVVVLSGPPAAPAAQQPAVQVIVRERPRAGDAPERAVRTLGGAVTRPLAIIHGFVARVPKGAVERLERAEGVYSVTADRRIRLLGQSGSGSPDLGSLSYTAEAIGAASMWKHGFTGRSIDVALVDTGVAPVEGLADKVVNGPDLSFESQAENLRHYDTFGHGTHMAGIIAGGDRPHPPGLNKKEFKGIAPDARIVSVKVGEAGGAADVSQVIAAIDWVVQNRRSNGFNIRVLNLSFGTDGVQHYTLDPLAYAAEVAWHKGIVVVVAGGNAGYGSAKLNNPAYDPFVIAVGASDPNGTPATNDDKTPSWSSGGDGTRNPDLVAPGVGIVSLRAPESYIDLAYPEGRVADRFFRGSGTSEAAAVVSGAAALVIHQRPWITPDQLKRLLTMTATELPNADPIAQGDGLLNLEAARVTPTPNAVQVWERSSGAGSLELARGTSHLSDEGVDLVGEIDIFGQPWDGARWSLESWAEISWAGGWWNGSEWTGSGWGAFGWSAVQWTGNRWSGLAWADVVWSPNQWLGNRWSGGGWAGNRWSGSTWSGNRWSTAWHAGESGY